MKRGIGKKWLLAVTALVALSSTPALAENITVDPALKGYVKSEGVSGNLNSIGSDTLNNLMTFWAEGFRKLYPNVNIQIEGKGSSTAPPALIEGTAQIGPMSREMKKSEIEAFEAKYGYKPLAVGVALDSLAVYVNKDNPLQELSLTQVDAIFSKTRKSGAAEEITTWGQVGLTGEWAGKPLSLYGRNSASGTYGYFKENALAKGDFKDTVKEQPGSASVVLSVTEDKAGIGYSGIGYKTSGVKALALAKKDGEKAYEPSYENVLEGKYPLGRMLYLYVAKQPNQPLPKMVDEFLKYALSKEGQEVVVKDGYLPLPATVAEKQLNLLK
ncbi:PstS family phosphate ABC transporter substrate-binding protein [Trichloromonas sp.]|uniref:PstS family phosphate ABC transporter substrate-binding protein n=1 Tax=Trichloromonas sp. TaxID=3069249 RepID=UPI002A45E967|nr:phosphate ABC transporter substrate-binding protein [Trichloromonas sp.]